MTSLARTIPNGSMIWVARLVLVVVAGGIASWAAFRASPAEFPAPGTYTYGPPCPLVQDYGVDPSTGEPHGRAWDCSGTIYREPPPPRSSVPLVAGFLVGSLGAAGVLFLIEQRRKRQDPVTSSS